MSGVLRHPVLHWVLGLVLGGVFLYASFDKIVHPSDFAKIVYNYRVIGPSQSVGFTPANTLAVVLPWVEAVCGVCLVVGLWRREAAVVAGLMLVMFVAAVSLAMWQGVNLANCGCFKVSAATAGDGRALGVGLIVGDLALLAVAGVLAFVPPRARAAAPSLAEASPVH